MKFRKTTFLLLVFSYVVLTLPAQDLPSPFSDQKISQPKPRHCDPLAATLSLDLNRRLPLDQLDKKYNLSYHHDKHYVAALMKVAERFDPSQFNTYQVQVNSALGAIYSVHIPIDQYANFIDVPGIDYIELAKKVHSRLETALEASKVDLVHIGENLSQAYSGKGVVMGIIDFGFDYTHPTFYDSEGSTYRIKKVWDQNSLEGEPPAGYSYGHELSSEQALIEAQTDVPLTGHGTHVAGIAAGSGGTLSELYRGVAYESDIVLVSANSREGITGKNTGIIDGINYIFQYADSVGKPAVVNLSQGHHTGPHDGTSLADQAMDILSGPGRIIVGSVGNEGDPSGFYLHFDHNFENENAILSYLVWPDGISSGITLVDIWGEEGANFDVGIEVFNPKTKVQEAISTSLNSDTPVSFVSGTLVDLEGDTLYYEGGIEINPLNNRPHALLYIDNTGQSEGDDVDFDDLLDNDFVQLRFQADRGTVHAYAANNSGEAFFTDLSGIGADEFIEDTRVLGGNPNSTMGELGGTARSIISVGGYTTENSFVNTDEDEVRIDEVIGDYYINTSRGPTLDGRLKPDISAPANLIGSAESSFYAGFDPFVEVAQIDKGDGTHWPFSIRRGTSTAAPLVAGIAGLMLELAPDLTPEEIKERMAAHAAMDEFTGVLPNQVWGHGKIDAYGIISSMEQPTSIVGDQIAGTIDIYPNPNNGRFVMRSDLTGKLQINVFDLRGRSVFEKQVIKDNRNLTIDLPIRLGGMYFLKLRQNGQVFSTKLIINPN